MSTIIGNPIMLGGGVGISAPIIGKDFNWTGGDGTYQVIDDGDKNWRIKFLSSGIFTPRKNMVIDSFLVGGGGSGSSYNDKKGAGGGGGYTLTSLSIVLTAGESYSIVIGAGGASVGSSQFGTSGNSGGSSSAFGLTVDGGYGGGTPNKSSSYWGGDGGSGGGSISGSTSAAAGGSDGSDGGNSETVSGGTGQGTTTREFGESTGDLYAGGGGGQNYRSNTGTYFLGTGGAGGGADASKSAAANTGGGGGGYGGAGGSGIVIIRKHKEAAA